MRRFALCVLILSILLLCACDSGKNTNTPTEPAAQTSSAPAATPQAEATVPSETAPPPFSTTLPGLCENLLLYESKDITLRLLYGLNLDTGESCIVLKAENRSDEHRRVVLDSTVLNGSLIAKQDLMRLRPGEEDYFTKDDWSRCLVIAKEPRLLECTGVVQVYPGDALKLSSETLLEEQQYHVVFRADGTPGLLSEPFPAAQIPQQILRDDEICRLTLLCLGKAPTGNSNKYQGLICAENKTDHELPISVNGITVNRRTIKVSRGNGSVSAHHAAFQSFDFYPDDLEAQRITDVRSVDLLILSDRSENTGTLLFSGGSVWYPLAAEPLTEVPEEPPVEEGTVLLEKNGVCLRLLGQSENWWDWLEQGYYCWDLYLTNETDQTIELDLEDILVNGVPDDSHQPRLTDTEVAPGCSRFCCLRTATVPAQTPRPEISGTVRVCELGATTVLFISDPITFSAE